MIPVLQRRTFRYWEHKLIAQMQLVHGRALVQREPVSFSLVLFCASSIGDEAGGWFE